MAAQVNQRGLVDPAGFKRMNQEITRSSQVYRNALASTGMFRVEQLKVNSATDEYTKSLQKQKMGLRDLVRNQKVAAAAYREQLAMQQMMVRTSASGVMNGKQVIDVSFPSGVNEQLNTFGNRLGWAREQMRSLGTQTVNWGKNTQWAGRQLMTGFTYPVAAAGAGMAMLAYQADQQLSRIAKVYDTYAQDQAGKEKELAQLRQDSMNMGKDAAAKYGAALNDTLKVEAELAATGLQGENLRRGTMETVRIATLGELEYGSAIQTTIALQNAFKMSNEELTDTFNYMNAVENATSLSIQDIAEATPRAASAMASLGVTAKEMTVMLVAMKERGVDAAEGANALKSATTRILSPVKAASTYFAQFGVDLNAMSTQSGGNLYKFLQLLSEATKGMDDLTKQRGIAKLFGTYQYNRMNAALQGVTDGVFGFGDATSQTYKAVQLLTADSATLAASAQQELDRAAANVSMQFKKSLESLKVQLAEAGMPFLEVGNAVLKVVLKIVSAFNGLPEGAQKFAVVTAIFLGLVGPGIMLVGLLANLFGNFIKMGVAVTGVATKFNLLTKEQIATRLAAKATESGFISERQALANLTSEMQKYALAQQAANRTIINRVAPTTMAAPASTAGSMAGTFSGGWMPSNVAAAQANNAAASKAAADASEKQRGALKGVAESGGVFAAAMVASAVSSNETVDSVANMAMLAAIAAPALVGMAKGLMAVQWSQIGSTISSRWAGGLAAASGSAGKLSTSLSGASGAMGKTALAVRLASSGIIGMIGPVGIVMAAVAAGAVAWKLISDHADKARKSVEQMSGTSEGLGKILGFTPRESSALDATSKKASDVQDRINAMRGEIPVVVDRIREATDETAKFQIAMQNVGLKTLDIGGTVDQAKEAVKLALQAAGMEAERADALVLTYKANFDPKGMAEAAQKSAQTYMSEATRVMTDKGFAENIKDPFAAVSRASVQNAEEAGGRVAQAFKTSMDAKLSQSSNMQSLEKLIKPMNDELAKMQAERDRMWANKEGTARIDGEMNRLEALNGALKRRIITELGGAEAVKDATDADLARLSVADVLSRAQFKVSEADRIAYLNAKNLGGETLSLAEAQELSAATSRQVAEASKKSSTAIKSQGTAAKETTTDLDRLTSKFKSANDAFQAYGEAAVTGTKAAMTEYSDQATSNFNNRMNAAMDAYKANQEARMDGLKNMQDRASKALEARQAAEQRRMDSRQDSDQRRMESAQQAASRRLESIQDAENDRLEKRQEAATDALEARHESATKGLERRQEARRKAIESAYDARINKIEQTMKVEQSAEEARQRIFEAEMTRISRLAEMANRNIDFNVAINTGNMDEAAKIMNDATAAEQQWGMSDANESAKDSFSKRQTVLQTQIDNINKAKDARLESLRIVEERETAAIAAQQEREKKALQATLEREKAAVAARQERQKLELQQSQERQKLALQMTQEREKLALSTRLQREKENLSARQKAEQDVLSKRITANINAEQRIWDLRKAQLDRAIKDFQNFAPKNAQELQKHITDISGRYDQFRVATRGKFNGTAADVKSTLSRNVNQAMLELQTSKAWEAVGASIASKMTKGAFNMDMAQFVKWVTTGEAPKNWAAPKPATAGGYKPTLNEAKIRKESRSTYHTGGKIGTDPGGRAGITGSGLHRSERMVLAQDGEFMVNRKAAAQNEPLLRAINSGKKVEGLGAGPGMGLVGMLAGGIAGMASAAIGRGIEMAGARATARDQAATSVMGGMFTNAKAGKYSGLSFSAEQLANAAIIANVGSTMNMSARDIQIGIMTAITESGLRNLRHGDRDSQGLFQQRPSQGWGTIAQITDPTYSAGKFFEALKQKKNRGAMDPWLAAQSVQRSFDSSGGNYKQYWDEAMAIFGGMGQDTVNTQVPGGAVGPANRTGQAAIAWAQARLGDEGWLGLCQKFVRMALGAGGGFPSAIAAWHGAGKKHGISNPNQVPAGVPVYWSGGTYGHVALSTGGGRIIGTDFPTMGRIGAGTIAGLTQRWNKPLLGWTEDINGKKVYGAPGMKTGGFAMSNGLANLHGSRAEPETVLTASLTKEFKQGVRNFADGGGTVYNLNVDARGAERGAADDIVKKTITELKRLEARKPQSRKGTG